MPVRLIDLACPAVIIMALCAGAGAMVASNYDQKQLTKADERRREDVKREHDASADRITDLKFKLKDLQDSTHAESDRKFKHDLAVAAHSQRMRHELETLLADARGNADRCTADAARLATIADAALDAIDETDRTVRKAAEDARRLEGRNVFLEGKVREWEAAYPEQQRITVTGKR
jgi:hypothetical protein